MSVLKLETCKMLNEIGCVSESEFAYEGVYLLPIERAMLNVTPGFTWEDICNTDNAKAIWGVDTSFFKVPAYIPEVHHLLNLMLEGKDWEECLLNQLKVKKNQEVKESVHHHVPPSKVSGTELPFSEQVPFRKKKNE